MTVNIKEYAPNLITNILEFKVLYETENVELSNLHASIEKIGFDMFVQTATEEKILQIETFLRIKGQGTIEQRRNYLLAMFQKNTKLNEPSIKIISDTLAGADCIVTFYGADDVDNPSPGDGLLYVQVLSPSSGVDYKYDDIYRTLKPLIPAHLNLIVMKYFSSWNDVKNNFTNWADVASLTNWNEVKNLLIS